MDELIQAMSIPELKQFAKQFEGNESIQAIVNGAIETKKQEESRAKLVKQFEAKVESLSSLPEPPPGVHNIYMSYQSVTEEVDDTDKPQEEVDIITTPAIQDKDGNITKPAVHDKQMRYPKKTVTVSKWVVETNKAMTVTKGSGSSREPSRKVKKMYRKESDGSLTAIESPEPIRTWSDWVDYLNEHTALLHTDETGKAIPINKTTASKLVDLKTAGFMGVEAS